MPIHRLDECRTNQLGSLHKPVVLIATKIDAFRRLIAESRARQKLLEACKREAAAGDRRYLGNLHLSEKLIAAPASQEAAGLFVVDIKAKKPVRQSLIDQRVLRIAPFTKQNVPIHQAFEQSIRATRKPLAKGHPLP